MVFRYKLGMNFFFRLCAFDLGRVMRVDVPTIDRDWLDYARILIATSSLEVIIATTDVLIDDVLVTIKVVEEWGFSLGEDACLSEEESTGDVNENVEDIGDSGVINDMRDGDLVDNLVNDISEDVLATERVEKNLEEVEGEQLSVKNMEPASVFMPLPTGVPKHCNEEEDFTGPKVDGQVSEKQIPCTCTHSCPPSRDRSMIAGPWSLEWLRDYNHEDAGVIFSASKESKKNPSLSQRQHGKNKDVQMPKKKVDGVQRHPGGCLKKVARLPYG